jgi:hypothetical protein
MRALPLLGATLETPPTKAQAIDVLLAFRGLDLSWATAAILSQRTRIIEQFPSLIAAVRQSGRTANDDLLQAMVEAFEAILSFDTAKACSSTGRLLNAVNSRAGPSGFSNLMAAFAADAEVLDSGYDPVTLARSQLWPSGPPRWLLTSWAETKAALDAAEADWAVWTDWYEARLRGIASNDGAELERLTIPERIWEMGATAVNRWIIELRQTQRDSAAIGLTSDLEGRLQSLPADQAALVGARAVLRAIPLFNYDGLAEPEYTSEFLSVLRLTSMAWTAGRLATRSSGNDDFVDAYDRASLSKNAIARVSAFALTATAETDMHHTIAETMIVGLDGLRDISVAIDGVAAGAVFNMAIEDDLSDLQQASAAALASISLWSGGEPPAWVATRWEKSRQRLLSDGRGWDVWVRWYEARIYGVLREDSIERAYINAPNALWQKGPSAINDWILKKLEEPNAATTAIPEIPAPGPGPRFGIGEDGLIDRIVHSDIDEQGNDLRTINQLKPLVQRCVSDLEARLSRNEFPELLTTIGHYRTALLPDGGRSIEWGEVWGLGVMLQNIATAAERQIALRTLPPLEDPAKSSLDSLLALHGPLILATRDGASLSASAQAFTMTREQIAELRAASEQLAEQLAAYPEVITPSAVASVSEAVNAIGEGIHPERGSVYALATVKNVAVVLIGGAAVATPTIIGALLGSALMGTVVGAPLSLLAVEAIKKNAAFVALATRLGAKLDMMSDAEVGVWIERRARGLAPFRSFVIANEAPLRRIAESTNELRWMLRYVDFVVQKEEKAGRR